jgi:hypothetical protein
VSWAKRLTVNSRPFLRNSCQTPASRWRHEEPESEYASIANNIGPQQS